MNLPREVAPPPELREMIAAKLQREGFLRRRTPWLAIAAAVLIAAALGALLWPHSEKPVQANYILLLYEPAGFHGGSRVEYARWARDMRPLVVGGEELGKDVIAIGTETNSAPAGYFLIRANDDASAARVARACPHLRHGGSVVLRRIII